ncbi:hypothetical protein [Streptomyces sp.]|uniref:hypothetical protein n=1 Tax=Streptomyces sp. TaxID=1931 RepID=UPI003D6C4AE7
MPSDVRFVGRERELAVVEAGSGTPALTVDGMPGIGKTALAIRAAHRMAPQFHDGVLSPDLHGYTRDRTHPKPTCRVPDDARRSDPR